MREIRRAWITAGHSELWGCDSTYCTVPYSILPSVDEASDDMRWLDNVSPKLKRVIENTCTLDSGDNEIGNTEEVFAAVQRHGLNLPESFTRFLREPALQQKVPTCTDCILELSEEPIRVNESDGDFLLRFMNDSQSCVLWYLYMTRGEESRVLASFYFLERDIFDAMEYEDIRHSQLLDEACICAGSFTEFIYRFWVENTIWYSLHKGIPMTATQEAYRRQITTKL